VLVKAAIYRVAVLVESQQELLLVLLESKLLQW